MDTAYSAKLKERQEQIEVTLNHLQRERREVEESTAWMDGQAYRNRIQLFNRLARWYHEEMSQIEKAFHRMKTGSYGLCLGCGQPIEPERLEASPAAELCGNCEEIHEELRA